MAYELYHSAKGSGWKNHKYVSKKTINGKVRYFYGNNGASKSKEGYSDFGDWFGSDEADELTKSGLRLAFAKNSYEDALKSKKTALGETSTLKAKYTLAKKDYDKKKAAYDKTPMGQIEQVGTEAAKAVKKGASWVKKQAKKAVATYKRKKAGANVDVTSPVKTPKPMPSAKRAKPRTEKKYGTVFNRIKNANKHDLANAYSKSQRAAKKAVNDYFNKKYGE